MIDEPRTHILIPMDPHQLTGGYRYDGRMVDGLRAAGVSCTVHRVAGDFPQDDEQACHDAERLLGEIGPGRTVLVDGLLLPTLAEVLRHHADRLRLVALVHHPAALEGGLSRESRERLLERERSALLAMRRVVATSIHTKSVLTELGVPAGRIGVAVPGTDPAPLAVGTPAAENTVHLVCVAAVTPRKGHSVLMKALERITHLPWRLSCAGDLAHDGVTAQRLRNEIDSLGLSGRVHLLGEIPADELAALYDEADVFVLPSRYEGYGMAITEAVARGLPIVSTTAGAIPSTAPPEGARLVPADDAAALADALVALIEDPKLRATLAEGSRRARERLLTWPEATARFAAELERI